jgi:hypothetical protein
LRSGGGVSEVADGVRGKREVYAYYLEAGTAGGFGIWGSGQFGKLGAGD